MRRRGRRGSVSVPPAPDGPHTAGSGAKHLAPASARGVCRKTAAQTSPMPGQAYPIFRSAFQSHRFDPTSTAFGANPAKFGVDTTKFEGARPVWARLRQINPLEFRKKGVALVPEPIRHRRAITWNMIDLEKWLAARVAQVATRCRFAYSNAILRRAGLSTDSPPLAFREDGRCLSQSLPTSVEVGGR